jgi:hypothetical protein
MFLFVLFAVSLGCIFCVVLCIIVVDWRLFGAAMWYLCIDYACVDFILVHEQIILLSHVQNRFPLGFYSFSLGA